MPEPNQKVLAYYENYTGMTSTVLKRTPDTNGKSSWDNYSIYDWEVTHWMPLPEPPPENEVVEILKEYEK